MAYVVFKDLPKRTASDKVLSNKAFNIAKNPKYDGYKRGLSSIVYQFFDKKASVSNTSGNAVKSEIVQNKELLKESHTPIIQKFEKRKVH